MTRDRWWVARAIRLAVGLSMVACGGSIDLFGTRGGGGGGVNEAGGASSNTKATGGGGGSSAAEVASAGAADAPGLAGASGGTSPEPETAGAPSEACSAPVAVTVPQVNAAESAQYRWSECGRIAPSGSAVQALYADDGSIVSLEERVGVRIYEPGASSGSILADIPVAGDSRMAFADGGSRLLLWDPDRARVLEATDQKPIGLDSGKLAEVITVDTAAVQCGGPSVLSSDGSTVAAQGAETLCAWDVDQGGLLARISLGRAQSSWPSAVGTNADGSRLLIFRDGRLSSYTLSGQRLQNVDLAPLWRDRIEPERGASAAFSADGKYLLVLAGLSGLAEGQTGHLIAFDASSGVVQWQQQPSPDAFYLALSARGYAQVTGDSIYRIDDGSKVAPSPASYFSGGDVNAAGTEMLEASRQVRVWDFARHAVSRMYGAHSDSVHSLDLSRDGRFLASHDGRGAILWQLAPDFSRSIPLENAAAEGASLVALAPDGAHFVLSGDVVASTGRDGSRQVLGGATPSGAAYCFFAGWDYAPNGCFVAGMRYTNDVLVYDAEGRKLLATRATGGCGGVAFSPDGSRLMTAQLELFDTRDWSLVWSKIPANDPPPGIGLGPETTIDYAPDGREVVTTSCTGGPDSCSSSRFDARTGETLASLSGLTGFGARYSPEGQWIVSGGALQHLPSGNVLSYDQDAHVATFTAEGDIIAGESDGSLVRYCRAGP